MSRKKEFSFGDALLESLEEVRAWRKGEADLEVVTIEPLSPDRIRAIRKKVAKSAKQFEAKFGIPASTVNNWEQGRRQPDPAGRLLLEVIDAAPEIVEDVASKQLHKAA